MDTGNVASWQVKDYITFHRHIRIAKTLHILDSKRRRR